MDITQFWQIARIIVLPSAFGYFLFLLAKPRFFGFTGLAACSFVFFMWEELLLYPFHSAEWIAVYFLLVIGMTGVVKAIIIFSTVFLVVTIVLAFCALLVF